MECYLWRERERSTDMCKWTVITFQFFFYVIRAGFFIVCYCALATIRLLIHKTLWQIQSTRKMTFEKNLLCELNNVKFSVEWKRWKLLIIIFFVVNTTITSHHMTWHDIRDSWSSILPCLFSLFHSSICPSNCRIYFAFSKERRLASLKVGSVSV